MKSKFSKLALAATLGLAITLTLNACEEKKKPDSEPAAAAAEKPAEKADGNTFTDSRDGKKYKTVKIGEQVWMAENLNYAAKGSKCYGEGDKVNKGLDDKYNTIYATLSNAEIQANCAKYGRLYDLETAKTVCPAGYHLPSREEWDKLPQIVGGEQTKECGENGCEEGYIVIWEGTGKKLKSKSGWNDHNGTDDFGFSALPGGYRMPPDDSVDGGTFYGVGNQGSWRMANGYGYTIDDYDRFFEQEYAEGNDSDNFAYSVRCIKD